MITDVNINQTRYEVDSKKFRPSETHSETEDDQRGVSKNSLINKSKSLYHSEVSLTGKKLLRQTQRS